MEDQLTTHGANWLFNQVPAIVISVTFTLVLIVLLWKAGKAVFAWLVEFMDQQTKSHEVIIKGITDSNEKVNKEHVAALKEISSTQRELRENQTEGFKEMLQRIGAVQDDVKRIERMRGAERQ